MSGGSKEGSVSSSQRSAEIPLKTTNSTPRTLREATLANRSDVVETLLLDGAKNEYDEKGWTPLHHASANGNYRIVQLLLYAQTKHSVLQKLRNSGFHPSIRTKSSKSTPLHLATQFNHPTTVKLLLQKGARSCADKHDLYPLHLAAAENHRQCATLLLDAKSDVNVKGEYMIFDRERRVSPLGLAIYRSHLPMVRLLLTRKASQSDVVGPWAAFQFALVKGNIEIITLLASHLDVKGLRFDCTSYRGDAGTEPPLHFVGREGKENREAVIHWLIDRGVDPNGRSSWQDNPMHAMAVRNDVNAATILLECGCNVNLQDKWGSTPLHFAVFRGSVEMVEFLLEHGAHRSITDMYGMTPLTGGFDATTYDNKPMDDKTKEKIQTLLQDRNSSKGRRTTPTSKESSLKEKLGGLT